MEKIEEKPPEKWSWLRQHADSAAVIAVLITVCVWIDGKFDRTDCKIETIAERVNRIENRLTAIETVLMMKNIMPCDMAIKKKEDK